MRILVKNQSLLLVTGDQQRGAYRFFLCGRTVDSSTMETSRAPSSSVFVFCFLLFLSLSFVPSVLSKSRPISDEEIRQKKNECYADIESGLWGWQCKSSSTAKENCALRCLSPPCYELIYESDPLEEGEKDLIRSQEYKYCMYKLSLGESIDGVRGSFDL
ncbi:PREDICTED: uncharacterized protein LOC104827245 [Tarenaya hassleriana]|uniref:uncharacterized protein LOC104827245 n=1 Tax=Tarenaya hassleriana TaxID=28532 RepID=UPI00053C4B38|nr:PREDICTED: uncharacterized protein LOC104827245 [Tarenaya hassleriana]